MSVAGPTSRLSGQVVSVAGPLWTLDSSSPGVVCAFVDRRSDSAQAEVRPPLVVTLGPGRCGQGLVVCLSRRAPIQDVTSVLSSDLNLAVPRKEAR